MSVARKLYRPAPVAPTLVQRRVPDHHVIPTADELMAWGALRAARLSLADDGQPLTGLNPAEVATRLRTMPRCNAAVAAGGFLGIALNTSRESAYAVIRAIFVHVPYRSDLHPVLLVVAARAGLVVEPRWVSFALAHATASADSATEPAEAIARTVGSETVASALISAVWRAWGPKVARELWDGFMRPVLESPAVNDLPSLPDALQP